MVKFDETLFASSFLLALIFLPKQSPTGFFPLVAKITLRGFWGPFCRTPAGLEGEVVGDSCLQSGLT